MSIIIHNTEFQPRDSKYYLDELIDDYIKRDKISDLYIVLPTAKWQRRLNNQIIKQYFDYHQKPVTNLNIYNLSKFAEYIHSKIFKADEHIIISDAYRLSLFEEACNKANLKFFRNSDQKMNLNLVKRLSQTIYGLKEDGIGLTDIEKDIENYGINKENIDDINRLTDIYELFKEFENSLSNNLLDLPALINKVTYKLNDLNILNPNKIKELVFDNNEIVVLVNGFTDFKKPEIEFLSRFGFSNVPLAINIDFSIKNGPLCGNMIETIKWLEDTNKFKYFDDDTLDFAPEKDYKELDINVFLRRHLFIERKRLDYSKLDEKTNIYELSDKKREVRFITKLIKKLIIADNYQPNDICVVSRRMDEYSNLFRNEFNKEKIPCNISDRFDLKSSPIVTLIFNVLELISNDYHRDYYIKILRNPILNFKNAGDGIDISNLVNVFTSFKLLRHPWEPKFENQLKYIQYNIEQKLEDKADDFEIYILKNEYKSVEKAYNDFKKIKDLFPDISKYRNLTSSNFAKLIKNEIVAKLGIIDKIREFYLRINSNQKSDFLIDYTFEEIEKLSRALHKFISLLDEMVFINNHKDKNAIYQLEELIERLKIAVSGEKFNIKERINYGVEVTSIEQIRGIPYKVSILCGAYEGNFPIGFKTDSFIGKDIPNSKERHYNSEQVQFYQFLTNNIDDERKKIVITYPATIDENELVASHFLTSLFKITTLEENSFKKIDKTTEKSITWLNKLTNSIEIEEENFINLKNGNINDNNPYFNYLISQNIQLPNIKLENLASDIINKYLINSDKKLSISDFEKYNECPYKYFVSKILKLEEIEESEKELSPLEKGNIIHYILFKFYNKIKESLDLIDTSTIIDNSLKTIKLNKNNESKIYQFFLEVSHNILLKMKEFYPFFDFTYFDLMGFQFNKELKNYPSIEKNSGKLIQWLRYELERHYGDWNYYPALFEYSFGFHRDSEAISISDKYKLRGKIDRVEFSEDGSADGNIKFLIADYKNKIGQKHNYNSIIKGESFQMPLYMYAFKNILEDKNELNAEYGGAVYYPTAKYYEKDKKINRKVVLFDEELKEKEVSNNMKKKIIPIEEVIDFTIDKTIEIVDNINLGIFDIKPNSNCQYCSYSSICRKNLMK